jgi:acyl carrier protein
MTNTLEKLNQVFQDLFDDDELEVNRDTQAEDVEGWDSVTHVSLMIKVEKVFGLKFTSAQVSYGSHGQPETTHDEKTNANSD